MSIGALEFKILADLATLKRDMDQAKGIVGGAADGMSRAFGGLKTALGAVGVALSAGAFAGWIKGAIDAADEASKLAKATGIATKDVAGLQLAFKLGGAGADAMQGTMSKLSKQIAEGAAVFDTLGIKTKNADGTLRSTKDVLYDTADAFKAMGSGTMATSKAVEIFGKSGADLVPMLLDGSDGLRDMADNAEKLGLVIGTETGKAAEEFNDTLDLLGVASKGVANQLMAQMLPTLNDLAGSMLNTVKNSDLVSMAASGIGVAFKLLYTGVAGVIGGFSAFGTYLGGLAAAAVLVAQGEFKQAYTALNDGWRDAGDIVKTTAKTIEDAWTGSGNATVTQAAAVNRALGGNTQTTKDYEAAVKAADQARKEAAKAEEKRVADELKAVQDIAKSRSEARQAEAKAIADWEKAEDDRRLKEVKSANDALTAAQREYDQFGLSRSQIAELTLQRLLDKQTAFTVGSANYESAQKEIDAHKSLIEVLKKGEVRDASIDAAKASAAEWQKTTDDIGRGLTDSLFRAFESGKGFFKTLWDGIKNLFKTTVLKLVMQPVQNAITGMVGGVMSGVAGTASAAGGGASGILGSVGGVSSLIGTLGTMGTTFGTGIGAGLAGTLGGAGAATFGAGASLAGAGATAGSAVGAAGGAGMMVGAAMPYIAAALALYAAYKALKHKPTPHQGSVVGVGADGTATTMYGDSSQILNNYNADTDTALRALGGASVGSLNSLSKAFGGTGGFGAEFKFATDGKDPSIGSALFSRNGTALAGGVGSTSQFAFYEKDREAAFTAFTGDVAAATRAALDGVALPKWARDSFAQLGSASTIEQFAALADAVTATQTALRAMQIEVSPLGGVFARVAGLSGDALKQLTDFAGGIEAFGAKTASYVKNYYSADEQAALSAASLQRSLAGTGVDLGALTDRASFRALVNAQDVGTEAGRKQLATLLSVGDTFAGLADYLEKQGGTLASLAALAPALGALGDLNAADTGVATVDGLATLDTSVITAGENVVTAIQALQASIEAGLASVATNTGNAARQLERWDDGGALSTVAQD